MIAATMYPVRSPMSDPPEAVNHQDAGDEHPGETQQSEQVEWHLTSVSSGVRQRSIDNSTSPQVEPMNSADEPLLKLHIRPSTLRQ